LGVTQQQVQDALAKVASPRGVALTNAGVLSAITVNDGKVFFSINVDAAEARAWEGVSAGAASAFARRAERRRAPAAARRRLADVEAIGNSRRCRGHCGGIWEGRRRQVDDRA